MLRPPCVRSHLREWNFDTSESCWTHSRTTHHCYETHNRFEGVFERVDAGSVTALEPSRSHGVDIASIGRKFISLPSRSVLRRRLATSVVRAGLVASGSF